jgi:UDP-N-acetylglucosamine acyltransferase
VDKSAEIDATADVGPYAVVERGVRIEADVRLYAHAYVSEGTSLGARCQVHPFAVVGHLPQDLKFPGEPTYTEIGEDTVIREHATVHRGTAPGSKTVVGRRCFIMSTGHVGHNCVVGDDVVIANGGLVAGHVEIGDRAFVSGNVVIHQFTRIGELAMLAGLTAIPKDVPPFMMVGRPSYVAGPNVVGLRRAGFDSAARQELRKCYHTLYREGIPFSEAVKRVAETVTTEPGRKLAAFLQADSKRGFLIGRRRDGGDADAM